MDPNNLNLKDIIIVISPSLGIVLGIILISNGHTLIGSLILLPIILVCIFSFSKLPFQEIAENFIQRENEKKKTIIGRIQLAVEKLLDLAGSVYLIFVMGALIWWYFFK